MAERLTYHWKHGWVPLTHAAALQKAHGSRSAAEKMVPSGHAHVGSAMISRGDLRRSPHVSAARAPGGKVALRDSKTGKEIKINESHAASFHNQQFTITGVHDGSFSARNSYGGEQHYGTDGRALERHQVSAPSQSVETMKMRDLKAQTSHPDPARRAQVLAEIQRRADARRSGSPAHGVSDYGTRYGNPTRLQSHRLQAEADAKVAEANRIAGSVGFGDRGAGRLNSSGLRQFNRNTDSSLQRTVAAHQAAADLQARANAARSREAEAARARLTHEQIKGATYVRDRHGWHQVVRVNAKSVTVKTPHSWTDTIPHNKIHEVRK